MTLDDVFMTRDLYLEMKCRNSPEKAKWRAIFCYSDQTHRKGPSTHLSLAILTTQADGERSSGKMGWQFWPMWSKQTWVEILQTGAAPISWIVKCLTVTTRLFLVRIFSPRYASIASLIIVQLYFFYCELEHILLMVDQGVLPSASCWNIEVKIWRRSSLGEMREIHLGCLWSGSSAGPLGLFIYCFELQFYMLINDQSSSVILSRRGDRLSQKVWIRPVCEKTTPT